MRLADRVEQAFEQGRLAGIRAERERIWDQAQDDKVELSRPCGHGLYELIEVVPLRSFASILRREEEPPVDP